MTCQNGQWSAKMTENPAKMTQICQNDMPK